MTRTRAFLNGALAGLLIVIILNSLAAHLLSDCGLPALLGLFSCPDSISRIGFPFVFLEQGGLAYHNNLKLPYLLLDLFINLDIVFFTGYMTMYWARKREKQNGLEG